MEKQGMDPGRRKHRAGLLIFCALLFLPAVFSRADEEESPEEQTEAHTLEVRLDSSPPYPEIYKPWSLFILVNHPIPQEVSVIPPNFPPSLMLERVRTDTRLNLEEERWTRVEYTFIPGSAETISIEPFEVKTPFAHAFTGVTRVRFREEIAARRIEPVFRWLTPVPSASPGEKAELRLELSNFDASRNIPGDLFRGRAPLNAIVGEEPPEAAGTGTYLYKITIIPLEESGVTLEPFSVRSGVSTLTVPGITVPVLAETPANFPPAREDAALLPDAPPPRDGSPASAFPEKREKVFFLFQGKYDQAAAEARALWNGNFKVEALASLRKNERDSFSGPYLVSLRRDIEERMGLGFTKNERWRPLKIPLAVYGILFAAGIFAAIFLAGMFLVVPRLRPEIPPAKLADSAAAGKTGARIGGAHFGTDKINAAGKAGVLSRAAKTIVTFRGINGFSSVVAMICTAAVVLLLLEGGFGNFAVGNFLAVRPGSSGSAAVLRETQGYAIPDSRGTVLDHFTEGQPVTVSGYEGEWCLAETHDGRSGWVTRESVITY